MTIYRGLPYVNSHVLGRSSVIGLSGGGTLKHRTWNHLKWLSVVPMHIVCWNPSVGVRCARLTEKSKVPQKTPGGKCRGNLGCPVGFVRINGFFFHLYLYLSAGNIFWLWGYIWVITNPLFRPHH